ncbi:hypothetical protein [Mycolicibacterium peregrinum]|uniref:hypothetical protein n=1 Tax=Mycolicibacterium peregrinum TaxID=43304 RepID=UPI0007EA9591|nr:hypothetical protein [Mycolicibacterium peregrinum]
MSSQTQNNRKGPSWWARRGGAALAAAVLIASGGAASAHADPLADSCPIQVSASQAVEAKIDSHNAIPHHFIVPRQQAEANAYDEEAARLNAEKDAANANLASCAAATSRLAAGGKIRVPLATTVQKMKQAQDRLGQQKPPVLPNIRGNAKTAVWEPGRELYDALRNTSPDQEALGDIPLQGEGWPEAGSPDPAYPSGSGMMIGTNDNGTPKVEPDHIVPLARLFYIPGFIKLPPQYMYQVAHSPLNMQWLSRKANRSKQAGEAAVVTGADPDWIDKQQELELATVAELTEITKQILDSLGIPL